MKHTSFVNENFLTFLQQCRVHTTDFDLSNPSYIDDSTWMNTFDNVDEKVSNIIGQDTVYFIYFAIYADCEVL